LAKLDEDFVALCCRAFEMATSIGDHIRSDLYE